MAYPERFTVAASHIQPTLEDSATISNEIKLALYALHQQATVGPCNQPKPWGWNAASNAKWQAWKELGELSAMEAMRLYVRTLDEEVPGWVEGIEREARPRPNGTAEHGAQGPADKGAEVDEKEAVGAGASTAASLPPAPAAPAPPAHKPRSVAEVVVEGSWVSPFIAAPRKPAPRYEHAVALLGPRAYVLGGSYSGRYLGDTWSLDLESLAWAPVAPSPAADGAGAGDGDGAALPPVAGHAALAWGAGVLAVGGHAGARRAETHLAVRALDPRRGAWTEVPTSWARGGPGGGAAASGSDSEAEAAPEAPARALHAPRGGHSASLLGTGLYVFGGEDAHRRALADLLVLDLPSMTWTAPLTTGKAPAPRTAHVATVWRERYLVIFGGGSVAHCFDDVHVLDTATLEWSQPEVEGPVPPPRAGHAAAVLGSTWYIVGGGNNAAGCADMYALDLGGLGRGEPLVWTLVGNTPPSSAIASEGLSLLSVPMAGCLVSFGGYNGKYHNSVHVYRPEGYVLVKAASAEARGAERGALPAGEGLRAGLDVGTRSSAQQPEDGEIERKNSEAAVARREAVVARESTAQELVLLRRQLATTQAALADAEQAARERDAHLEAEQSKVVRLEVEVAELRASLSRMAELERELDSYRLQATAAEPRKASGLWGFISGADANASPPRD
ncbi:hypothetical protein ACKKBG_A06980 [Auxenochlorella protothecoides x Auxenochlorella symbiontica]